MKTLFDGDTWRFLDLLAAENTRATFGTGRFPAWCAGRLVAYRPLSDWPTGTS